MKSDIAEILTRTSMFENVSRRSREAVALMCLPKALRKKQVLFSEGQKGWYLYLLVSGSVQLYKSRAGAKETVIKVVKPGELFAEAILFERDTYPVSAVALKTGSVYQIPKHQFVCQLEDREFREDFIANLFQKMRFLADQIQYLTSHDVEERLWLFLDEQFAGRKRFVPGMSKKDMAAAIGAAPETFSRLLLRLRQSGRLTWSGREIIRGEGAGYQVDS